MALTALLCPHWGLLPTSSFLPGSRKPCQDGRSVMGAWSMPSLPSAMPLAKRQQQQQRDTPPNNMNQQGNGEPGISCQTNQLQIRSSQVAHLLPCTSQMQPEALWKGPLVATNHQYHGRSQPLAPTHPQYQPRRKHSATDPHHPRGQQAVERPRVTTLHAVPLQALGQPCRAPDNGG